MDDIFKNQILSDLKNVFLDQNKFADPHNINGIDGVKCVVDSDTTQSLRSGMGRFEGAEKETIMLFVTIADWPGNVVNGVIKPSVPAYNQLITLDGARWRIKKSDPFNGMYELLLEAVK